MIGIIGAMDEEVAKIVEAMEVERQEQSKIPVDEIRPNPYQPRKVFNDEALKELNEREKEILILRYGLSNNDELTQKDVADLLGISQSYISRLEKKIIKKLRSQLNYDEVK